MNLDNLSLERNKNPIKVGNIKLLQPTLGDIDDLGWEKYQLFLYTIITDSKDIADILWFEHKIWYEDIKDEWIFFVQKCLSEEKKIKVKVSENNIVEGVGIMDRFRDALNFFLKTEGEYVIMDKKTEKESEIYLCNVLPTTEEDVFLLTPTNLKITKPCYYVLVEYLRKVNWIYTDYDFLHGGTKRAKKYILKHQYDGRKKKAKSQNITIDSIVSSLVSQSQPYKDIWDYPIYMIYELYYRYIKIDDWKNTMQALHSGCIDTKKNPIEWEKINWSSVINK